MLKNVKPTAFTKYLAPDKEVPSIEVAQSLGDKLVREQRTVQGAFTWVAPEPRSEYKLRWVSPSALKTLGIEPGEASSPKFAAVMAGKDVIADPEIGLYPYAQNYAGYQFGNWAGQLGDGRAISLFEIEAPDHKHYELQLKGAGLTPYSRFADGKAVLRSSIREALASEAVNALGIPTTRALSLVELPTTTARRERTETCAVISRFAESWVRIGTFDLYHSRGDRKNLRALADYCIDHVFGGFKESSQGNRYYQLFREVSERNARMIASTQAYGFLNGVLNTDNTSILGLSIDYGPFAFIDGFNFGFTSNHDDHENRYGFRNAPVMIWWNCVRLGESLGELIGAGHELVDQPDFIASGVKDTESRKKVAKTATTLIMDMGQEFEKLYRSTYMDIMRKRLGLTTSKDDDDEALVEPLLQIMDECELDYNHFFWGLSNLRVLGEFPDSSSLISKERGISPLKTFEACKKHVDEWLKTYISRLKAESSTDDDRINDMRKVNPHFVLRNWVLNDVITKANEDDWSAFDAVAVMALDPFKDRWDVGFEEYLGEVPGTERNIVCSCSS